MSELRVEQEHRVAPVELLFDLVFVFAFTQVTTLFLDDPTWHGLGRGLLVLAVLWWTWATYAWLTNTVDADQDLVIAVVLVALAAMFVAALAVPEAFGRHRTIFGAALAIVLAMDVALFAVVAKGDSDLLAAVGRFARSSMVGAALILGAAFVPAGLRPVLWLLALAAGMFGPLVGESLVALGFGARAAGLGAGVIVAAVLGVAIAASFWLAYFDFFSGGALQLLSNRSGVQRTAVARDVYSYLHLPMIAGIVLLAFGLRTTLAHVDAELDWIPAVALCGGSALYLFAYVAIRLRIAGSLSRGRSVATVAFVLLLPAAVAVSALVALALVAAVWLTLHAYELIGWREQRAQRRAR